MTRNDQRLTCTNVVCRNQTLTINHCLVECNQWRITEKKSQEQYENATRKGLCSGKDNEDSQRD